MSLVSAVASFLDRQVPRVASDVAKRVDDASATKVAEDVAPLGRDLMTLTDKAATGASAAKDPTTILGYRLLGLQCRPGMRGQITYEAISMIKEATDVPLRRRVAFLSSVSWITAGQFNAAAVDMILKSNESTADKLAALDGASGMSRFMTKGQFDWARSQILSGDRPGGALNFVFTHAIP